MHKQGQRGAFIATMETNLYRRVITLSQESSADGVRRNERTTTLEQVFSLRPLLDYQTYLPTNQSVQLWTEGVTRFSGPLMNATFVL